VRWLVAPQEFKGSLTAAQAAAAIAAGIREADPTAETDLCPLADGGPGTVAAALTVEGARERTTLVHDPLGRSIRASWAELPGGRAVLEMAAASGLSLLAREERSPLKTTTRGTGDLLLDAMAVGCGEFLLGVGGSATNDGGVGALQVMGVRFLDARGNEISGGGGSLHELADMDLSRCRFRGSLRVATDVTNPLLGPVGASAVYGPQKGASPEDVRVLDAGLARLAEVVKRALGRDVSAAPRTGAAGGLAYGLHAILGAELSSGFDAVAEFVKLRARVDRADVVITGEGRFDVQTAYGKGPARVAEMARGAGKRVCAVVGVLTGEPDVSGFDRIEEASPEERPASRDEATRRVSAAARRIVGAVAPAR
jgi:glycerate 2-kinase